MPEAGLGFTFEKPIAAGEPKAKHESGAASGAPKYTRNLCLREVKKQLGIFSPVRGACHLSHNKTQIGRALVSTHDYRRAVEYYRKALRGQPRSISLRHDLARLCLKLGRFEDASAVLRQVRVGCGVEYGRCHLRFQEG